MPRDSASLKYRPFLTPIWLTVMGAALAGIFLLFAVWLWGTADSTLVVVVRHAEKELNAGLDPPLTPAGQERAAALARLFGAASPVGRIDAIYASPARRNRMTAAPLAALLGLTPIVTSMSDTRGLAHRVLHEHAGGRILVVEHGDTLTDLVAALSGTEVAPLADQDYGTLYIVSVPRIGHSNVLRLRY